MFSRKVGNVCAIPTLVLTNVHRSDAGLYRLAATNNWGGVVSSDAVFTVIALRGTQNYQEWIDDATVVPQGFALASDVGSVHSGIYQVYTTGTDGLAATSSLARPQGSLAAQILSAVTGGAWPTGAPLFVTGHSLGAGLGELCAMDLASNAASRFSSLSMISFAPPKLSAGFLDDGSTLPFDAYDPAKFAAVHEVFGP